MPERKAPEFDGTELRRLAEKRLGRSTDTDPGHLLEAQRLLHELEVHQIELEMQNAELSQARNDVEAALERYTDLYDVAPVGYFTLDRQGTIHSVNLTGSGLLGIERSRLNGRRFDNFVAETSRCAFSALLETVFGGLTKESCEVTLLNEGLVQIEALVTTSGQECHLVLIDITERKLVEAALLAEQEAAKTLRKEKEAAEEALRQEKWAAETLGNEKLAAEALRIERDAGKALRLEKEAAEATARAKSQFLANMSHELRTPMTGILGMLQLALQEGIAPVPRRYLETTQNSAKCLLRILNDILDMAKIDAGRLRIEQQPFSLARCIAEAADLFSPELQRKGLDFAVFVPDGVPDRVLVDQVRLRQILINLIGNAVRFTEKGKVVVRLTVGRSTSIGPREFTFSVTDTGIGIPEDKKALLFRAFSQADVSHSRSFGGAGLGLAISKELVELMGGVISFESEDGAGSTFSFTIPLAEAKPCDAGASIEPQTVDSTIPAPQGERITRLLLAEDDRTISEILGVLLMRAGYQVDFARDGVMAVEMWQKGGYDLVLMDIQMPLLNGFEATSAIREYEQELGLRTPIIAMTAHALKEDQQRCLAAGMDGYIPKPIDFKQTLQVIRDMLQRD